MNDKNSEAFSIFTPLYSFKVKRCLSPETIKSDIDDTAHSMNLSSSGSSSITFILCEVSIGVVKVEKSKKGQRRYS